MKYIFKGNIRTYYCGDCYDWLYHAKIKLYQSDSRSDVTTHAVANAKDTFHQRSEEELKSLEKRFITGGETDDNGNFSIEIDEQMNYPGGVFEIDIECDSIPLNIRLREKLEPKPKGPLQFHITTLLPAWMDDKEQREIVYANWHYPIPYRYWCRIIQMYGLYVICGTVKDCKGKQPVGGVKVLAFDVDLIQDDPLGYGITDNNGHFKIYYTAADFSRTVFSWLNVEWPAGPDVYFRIEAADGTMLLQENRQRGHDRDRTNLSNCFCIDFCVECPKGSLVATLTQPAGCCDGSFQLVDGKYIPVIGTASGCGFEKYELELLWDGTDPISNSLVYANAAGNPDTGLTSSNHSVFNGNLGFIDVMKAIENAGTRIASSTNFTVHLRAYSGNGSTVDAWISFQIDSAEVYIKNIGGRVAPDVLNEAGQLRTADNPAAVVGTIGGNVGIYGAARIYGCNSEQIKEYSLYYKQDDFTTPQPPNSAAYDKTGNGWQQICRLDYTGYLSFSAADLINHNKLEGPASRLTNSGFYTYPMPVYIFGTVIYINVPKLAADTWKTGADNGRYSVLLEVIDTGGTCYYDIQRVWVDNRAIEGIITGIGDQPPCSDLYMKDSNGNFKTVNIMGTAYDPPIIPGDFTVPTSDNFDYYQLNILKQSAASASTILHSTSPVPARPSASAIGTLASFNLGNLDLASNPAAWPTDQLLAPGSSCNYNFLLYVYDKTLVSESNVHYVSGYPFPVKIINGNEP